MMKIKKTLFTLFLAIVFIGLNSYGSMVALGEKEEIGESITPVETASEEDLEIMRSLGEGVVYVSAKQICTQRMGCTCKHRSWHSDTLKKHHPEEDPYDGQDSWSPHLDIKCTKCNADWYCPVFKRFRGNS